MDHLNGNIIKLNGGIFQPARFDDIEGLYLTKSEYT